jgi:protein-disulfide isomerase
MQRLLCAVLLSLLLAPAASAQKGSKKASPAPPPVLLPSKDTVDAYMHHMLGYDPNVKWTILSIAESEVPGMALVVLRVGEGEGRMTQLYVSTDEKHAIMGEALPFGADPFADNRERLKRDAHGPAIGDSNAPVTIVEFSDLQCPHCKVAQPTIDRLLAEVPAARLVYEHFPLEALHPWAFKAATYSQCVAGRKPRAFWTFLRSVYDNQLDITEANADAKLKEYANASGLKGDEVAACALTAAPKAEVRAAMELGKAMGVTGTPMLFVNGRKIAGLGQLPYEMLKRLVEFEISEAQKAPPATESEPKE